MAVAILIVDSNSTDGTRLIATERGAAVLDAPMGKAEAMQYAFSKIKAKYIVMMDADNTYPARHISELLSKIYDGYDIVMGYRSDYQHGAMSPAHRFGNAVLSLWASALYGVRVHDVCTGMWAFRAEVLKKFNFTSTRFTLEADLFANAVLGGYKLAQLPISYRARLDGGSAKLKWMDGLNIALFLLKKRIGK